jgi:phosphodiesterase/alkaline phosphatase D-like protein
VDQHHSVRLLNLQPDTTYYFRVESAHPDRIDAESDLGVFKSLGSKTAVMFSSNTQDEGEAPRMAPRTAQPRK